LSLTRDEKPARLLANHVAVVKRLTRGPAAELVRRDRSLTRKYVAPYLARSFNHVERRRILLFHNDYLGRNLNALFFKEAGRPNRPIWSSSKGGRSQEIWMKANDLLGGEGDLTLVFAGDGTPLYELSFSLAPKAGECGPAAMLIVRIQGARGRLAEIRRATLDCGDISPAHLLLSAAEGVATALGVSTILGIGNEEQLSKSSVDKAGCLFDYDAFWSSQGGRPRRGWFLFEAPFDPRPLLETPAHNRRHKRRKRRIKAAVKEHMTATFQSRYARAAA
jgi:uncharacterized protein VirK/YbjX